MKCTLPVFLVCAFGCQQTAVTGTHLRLKMTAPHQAVLFLVVDDDVSYGGGLSAVENKTTWHGAMTGEQQSTFEALISESNWLTMKSVESEGEGIGSYNISIRNGTIHHKLVLPLEDTVATSIYDLLHTVADTRFQAALEALPKPSVDAMLQNRGLGEDN